MTALLSAARARNRRSSFSTCDRVADCREARPQQNATGLCPRLSHKSHTNPLNRNILFRIAHGEWFCGLKRTAPQYSLHIKLSSLAFFERRGGP